MIEIIKLSIKFLTICGKDSKDMISMFVAIFDNVYKKNKIDKEWIIYQVNNKLIISGIQDNDVLLALKSADVYEKNKQLGVAVLSTYESQYSNNNEKQISWDEAYSKISTYGSSYSLDHIMVQTPSTDDLNLKYYKLGNVLKLKNDHDFPEEIVHDGMDYDDFKSLILHRPGNLRLIGLDDNTSRGNMSDSDFNTNEKLEKRNDKICKFFVNEVIKNEKCSTSFDVKEYMFENKRKLTGNYDLSMVDLDYTKTKPKSITINGKSIEIKKYKEVLINIVKYIYEKNAEKLIELSKNNWKPRKRIILSKNKNNLTAPFEFIVGLVYLETNLSANDIIYYSSKLSDEFKIDKSLISIYIPE